MMESVFIYKLLLIVFLLVFNLGIAFLVLLAKPRKTGHVLFSVTAVLLTFYEVTSLLADFPFGRGVQELLLRLDFVFGVFTAFFYLLFTLNYPKKQNYISKLGLGVLMGVTALFSFIALFTGWIIKEVRYYEYGIDFVSGGVDYLFIGFIVIEIVVGLFFLLRQYKESEGEARLRMQYVLIGTAFVVVFTSAMLLLERINVLYSSAYYLYERIGLFMLDATGTITYVGVIGYSILRHRLFGIRIILAKALFWISMSLVLLFSFYLVVCIEQRIFGSFNKPYVILINVFLAFGFAILLSQIEEGMRILTERYVTKLAFDEDEIVESFVRRISVISKGDEILHQLLHKVTEITETQKVAIITLSANSGSSEVITKHKGFSEAEMKILQGETIMNYLTNLVSGDVVSIAKLLRKAGAEDMAARLGSMGLEYIFIYDTDNLSCILLLGSKKEGTAYIEKELKVVKKILFYALLGFDRNQLSV